MGAIITDKLFYKDVIIMKGNSIEVFDEKNTLLHDLYGNKIIFANDTINAYSVENIPEHVSEGKYCYTPEQGFYKNPNYVEPDPANTYGIPDELFNQIKSDYREQIAQEVSENGYNA